MKFIGSLNGNKNIDFFSDKKIQININKQIDINSEEIHKPKTEKVSSELKNSKLSITAIPYFFWAIGLIFIIFGFLLLANLLMSTENKKTIFGGFNEGLWWQYLITGVIISL